MSSTRSIQAGRAFVEFVAEATPLYRGLRDIENRLLNFTSAAGAILAGTGAATLWGLMPAVRAASREAETLNAFTEVFRGANEQASRLAQTLADDVGLSAGSIRRLSTPIGAMAKGLGLSADAAAELSNQAAKAALDISSFYNQDTVATADRIVSALAGSSRAVQQFGIDLRATALSAKLAELGYESNIQAAGELEKTLARMAIIQDALARSNALGDAARTAGQFANASRSLADNVAYLQSQIGNALIPVVERITAALSRAAKALGDFAGNHPILVQALAGMAAFAFIAGTALVGLAVAAKGLLIFLEIAFVVNLTRLAFTHLIPVALTATTTLGALGGAGSGAAAVGFFAALSSAVSRLGIVLQTYLLPFLAKLPVFRLVIPLVRGLAAAFAVVTGPIGITVAALMAVGAAVVYLQRRFGAFDGLIEGFKSVREEVANRLAPAWENLKRIWTDEIVPALKQLGQAFGAVFTSMWPLVESFGESLSTAMRAFAENLSIAGVAGVKLLTAAVETLTGALSLAYDMAAALGLVLSRDELERGQELDRRIAARQRASEQEPDAAGGAAFEISQALQDFAQGVRESTKTPLERYREYMQQLDEAFRTGLITSGQWSRAAREQREELARTDTELQQLKAFGDSLARSLQTPEEKFHEQMQTLARAAARGVITLELLERGQQQAHDRLLEHYQRMAEEQQRMEEQQAREAEQARKEREDRMREQITSRASFDRRLAEAQGEDSFGIRGREIRDLFQGGLLEDARRRNEDLLIDTTGRARDFRERADESREAARFGSFSKLEAVSGLGAQTVDQQLLKKAEEAEKQRDAATQALGRIVAALEE